MPLRGQAATTTVSNPSTSIASLLKVSWEKEAPASASSGRTTGSTDNSLCQEPGAGFNGMQRSVSRSAGWVSSGEFR